MINPRYLSAVDVAAYIGCSRNQVDNLVRLGKIPAPIRITDRLIRWDREAIDSALSAGRRMATVDLDEASREFMHEQDARRRTRRSEKAA